MKKIYFKSTKTQDFEELKEPRNGSWIDIFGAEHSEIKEIAEFLDLNYEDLRDSLDIFEVPRLEKKDGTVIIFVRYPSDDLPELHTQTLCIVVTPALVITITKYHNKLLKKIRNFEKDITSTQPSKFLIKILHEITREYTNQISVLIRKVATRRKGLNKIDDKDIASLIRHEEILNQYLSALLPMKNVLDTIISTNSIQMYEDDMELLNDLSISVNQSVDLCQVNLKGIRSLRDSHQIYFTNRLNKTIQVLTVFTIIMAVPTIISSIFGMNVELPLQNHQSGFGIIIMIAFLSSVCTFLLLKLKGWV